MKRFSFSKGFSLLELLIALIILSVSILALAGLMSTTTKNNAFGGHLTEAVTLAQDKLEELRALPWSSIAGSSDTITGSTGIHYSRIWEVRDLNPNLKEIEVTIRWADSGSHSLRFSSVLSNPEI